MSEENEITCLQCDTQDGVEWHQMDGGKLCIACYTSLNDLEIDSDDNQRPEKVKTAIKGRRTRHRPKTVTPNDLKVVLGKKDKGRRFIYKNNPPLEAPTPVMKIVPTDVVRHNGSFIKVGDIVSLLDEDDSIYYAQIKKLFSDQYGENSAVITWMIPTHRSPPPSDGFDPSSYILGPEEDSPRKLNCMEYVMHAPSDYFKSTSPHYQ